MDRYDSYQEMIIANQIQQEQILVDFKDLKLSLARQTNTSNKLEGLFAESDNLKRLIDQCDTKVQRIEKKSAIDLEAVDLKLTKLQNQVLVLQSHTSSSQSEDEKIQTLLESFKDRIIENIRITAEDSNNKIREIETKLREQNMTVSRAEANTLEQRNHVGRLQKLIGAL